MELIDIKDIKGTDWNYKFEDKAGEQRLLNSIKTDGQLRPIIVRENGKGYSIIEGSKIFRACQDAELKEIKVINLGKLRPPDSARISILLNETQFKTDYIELAEKLVLITEKYKITELANLMPFSQDDLNRLIGLLRFDWSSFDKKGDGNQAVMFDIEESKPETGEIKSEEELVSEHHRDVLLLEDEQRMVRNEFPCENCLPTTELETLKDPYKTRVCDTCQKIIDWLPPSTSSQSEKKKLEELRKGKEKEKKKVKKKKEPENGQTGMF